MASKQRQRILLATDFSDGAQQAADVARAYAREMGAELYVLHVTRAGSEEEMKGALSHWAGARLGDAPLTVRVEAGAPVERIVEYARTQGVTLIVMGTHGRTGFVRALLGSVSEGVARNASCPVVTVTPQLLASQLHAPRPQAVPVPSPAPQTYCLVCHTANDESICATCRAKIQGEALGQRREEERKARV